MSGASRVFNSTAGSTFLAVAKACALSSAADRAARLVANAARRALGRIPIRGGQ